jgi:hypothetical protein
MVSETRDIFEGRVQNLYQNLVKVGFSDADSSLIYAVTGELGNNAYDHNLGKWADQPGCFFCFELQEEQVIIAVADRGRGILSSLQNAIPSLRSEQIAIETAFEKRVSGRAPERRGNGLKFVREIINGNLGRGLFAVSGDGKFSCGGNFEILQYLNSLMGDTRALGTLVLLAWRKV